MNTVDILIVLGLTFFAYKGYMNGFVHELLSLIAMLTALAAAFRWTPILVPKIADSIPGPAFVETGVSFMVLFALVLWTGRYVVKMVRRFWVQGLSSPMNRVAGLSFGIFKGAVVLGCTLLALRAYAPDAYSGGPVAREAGGAADQINDAVDDAILAPRLADLTSGIFSVVMIRAEDGMRSLAPGNSDDIGAVDGS
jgi:membrane protein required for colicin V production